MARYGMKHLDREPAAPTTAQLDAYNGARIMELRVRGRWTGPRAGQELAARRKLEGRAS